MTGRRMRIGMYVTDRGASGPAEWVARCERAEAAGFHTAWAGQMFGHEALTLVALAALRTRQIELGTWVLPIQPRHPVALAQQASTVQSAAGGRLLLGLGVSHAEVIEKRMGLAWRAPVRHMAEYLDVLLPLLRGEPVDHAGEQYRVSLQLGAADAPPAVFLAALGPRMLELAGARAGGVAVWLCGERALESFTVPRILAGARAAARPPPRIACGLPVAVTTDRARARASAEAFLARSAKLPAYRRVLEREGAASPGELAILGDETAVAARLARLAALGVTDFTAVPFPVEGDPGAVDRTWRCLSELARAA
jgi:F420-dependent oxidoreductase-like protein